MADITSARILVTGGSGFIGTNLLEHCRNAGIEVRNLDTKHPQDPAHRDAWRDTDLVDREQTVDAVTSFQPTHVLHMAARTDLNGRSVADYAANTTGLENLLEALNHVPAIERAVFASSRLVCEIGYQPTDELDVRPTTAYGASKVDGERILRSSDPAYPWLIVRPTSIWGPWFDVPYRAFFRAVAKGRYVHPRGRTVLKTFGYVDNSVAQLFGLLTADAERVSRRTFYLADDPPLEVSAWARSIAAETGTPMPRRAPIGLLRAGALAGDLAQRAGMPNPPLTSFRLNNLLTEMVHDRWGLDEAAGHPAMLPIEEGVRRTVAWMRRQGDIGARV